MNDKMKLYILFIDKKLYAQEYCEFDVENIDVSSIKLYGIYVRPPNDDVRRVILKLPDEYPNLYNVLVHWINLDNYRTLSVVIDNILIFPDFMNNLTFNGSHPKDIIDDIEDIRKSVSDILGKEIKTPKYENDWYNKQLCKHLNYNLRLQRMLKTY